MLNLHKKPKEPVYRSPEYKQFLILRLLNLIMVGVMLLSAFYIIWFVHNNVYNVIDQAEVIISAQDNIVTEAINFEKYEKVKNNWTNKTMQVELDILKDPFNTLGATLPIEK